MPKRKTVEQAHQEAADHQRRATEIRNKAAFQEVLSILKKNPTAAEPCLKALHDLGFTTETAAETMPTSRAAKANEKRVVTRKLLDSQRHPTLPIELTELPPEAVVPTRFNTLGSLTMPLVQKHILQVVEPSSLSPANLRSMVIRGKMVSSKDEFDKLTEFATGWSKDAQLVGAQRVWDILSQCLKNESEWRGRRCSSAILPIDWNKNGVYEPLCMDGKTCVRIRKTGVAREIPAAKLPDIASDGMHIEHNHSETKAVLYFSPGVVGQHFRIVELFPDASAHILPEYMEAWKRPLLFTGMELKSIVDKYSHMTTRKPVDAKHCGKPPLISAQWPTPSDSTTSAASRTPVVPVVTTPTVDQTTNDEDVAGAHVAVDNSAADVHDEVDETEDTPPAEEDE